MRFKIYELQIVLRTALKLPDLPSLQRPGLDTTKFGRLSYDAKDGEYPRTQQIGEVAHLLDFDGLVVPSARSDALNVVIFCSKVVTGTLFVTADRGLVEW